LAKVFVSHASKDLALAKELHQWLADEGHEVFLDHDLRDGIAVGEEWEKRLHERLRWANAVVCVITAAYLASEWCAAEVNTAKARGNRLLPVRAEPGVIHALLRSIQHTDMTSDRVAARAALGEALRRVDAAGHASWPENFSPFPGLRPFDSDRHRVFFGRSQEVEQLAELLRSSAELSDGAALLVVGASGCGKSSLVRAGLLPVMAGEPGWWPLTPIVPGSDPMAALARGLFVGAQQIGLGWTVDHVRDRLAECDLSSLAEELLLAVPGGSLRRLLLVMDQFEELFTQSVSTQRARFAEVLHAALRGPIQVVGTLRSESLNQWLDSLEFANLPTRTYMLRPLRYEMLHTVIEEPARLAGIGVDGRLVAQLVDDTGSGAALPLLAFTLAELGDGLSRGGQLSGTRYDELGGVQGALTREADAALADAVTASGRSREEVIAALLRLVTIDGQGRPTRWQVGRDELPDSVVTELNSFIARRLLTTDAKNGRVVIGVAHEAFLTAWAPLAEAIAASASALRARRAVEYAAEEWDKNGHLNSRLWGGGQLAAAVADIGARIQVGATGVLPRPTSRFLRWLPGQHRAMVADRVDLSVKARAFLHASIRHDRYRRRRATIVLSVLLVLALIAAGVAVIQQGVARRQQRAAEEQQRIATARQLVVQAKLVLESDPRTALRFGIAAERIHPGAETHANLVNILTATHYAGTLTGHTDSVYSMVFYPDGRTLVTGGLDKMINLWDLADSTGPRRLGIPVRVNGHGVSSLALQPGGSILAAGEIDGTVVLWDLGDRTRPRRLGQLVTGQNCAVYSLAFADKGNIVAASCSGSQNSVVLWDIADPTRPRRLGQPLVSSSNHFPLMVLSPDGTKLAAGDFGGDVILWDLANPAQPRRLRDNHTGSVTSVAFSPNGTTLAAGMGDGTVSLWDITNPAHSHRLGQVLNGHVGPVSSIAFSPDEATLATGGHDRMVIVWDLTNPAQPRRLWQPFGGHTSAVTSIAFAPGGTTLATGSNDGPVILWNLTDPAQPRRLGQPLTNHGNHLVSASFAPKGATLATGSSEGTVILWDLTDPTQPQRLRQPLISGGFPSEGMVTFTPEGTILAARSSEGTVILWDLTDPAQPRRLGQPLTNHGNDLVSASFAPKGATLATGSSEGTVILWDLTDPTQPRRLGQLLTGHTEAVSSIAFSRNGTTLAIGSFGSVTLWNLTDPPRHLGEIQTGHSKYPSSTASGASCIALSPDGTIVATGSYASTVSLWYLAPGQAPRLGQPLTGHTEGVNSVAFSRDGTTLATGSFDGSVILWDLTDRAQPRRLGQPLTGHTNAVYAVAFAPDGNTLAAVDDGTVILWDVTQLNHLRSHTIKRACAISGGGLDYSEWIRFMSGLPYQDTCPTPAEEAR